MADALTLEWMLTAPEAFAIGHDLGGEATPIQRAIARAAEGRPLGDLAQDPGVIRAFGGLDAIASLTGLRPKQIYILAGIRGGKSLICAAAALYAALTVDLSTFTRVGEPVVVSILSLDKYKAGVIYQHILTTLMQRPALRALLAREPTKETISIRRPQDARLVEIHIVAGKRAGAATIARWNAAIFFDEAAFMQGADDAVINLEEAIEKSLGRLLPGGFLWCVSSPHAPRGPIYEAVKKFWGKPSRALLIIRATGPEMNPKWWTPARIAELKQESEGAYRTDVLGEFADAIAGFFTEAELTAVTRRYPGYVPRDDAFDYGAAMDPASRGNAWTLVVAGKRAGATEADARINIVAIWQRQGSRLEPLRGEDVFREMAAVLKQYGIHEVYSDQYGFDPYKEIAAKQGIVLTKDERTTAERTTDGERFRARVVAGTIELPSDPTFFQDLMNVQKRLTATGVVIEPAHTSDGRHGDYWPAAVMAAELACQQGPGWIRAMTAIENRGGLFPDEGDQQIRWCAICNMNYTGKCPEHGGAT